MVEETVTAPVSTETVPTETNVPADTGKASETVTPETGTTPEEESFTKFDPKTATKEELKAFKKLQADYTRARQADKTKLSQMEQQISSLMPLLSDPDVKAIAYFRQFGKFPEGYQGIKSPEVKQPDPNAITPEELANLDPVSRKIYENYLKLQDQVNRNNTEKQQGMEREAVKTVTSFRDKLSEPQKKIWNANVEKIRQLSVMLAERGAPVEEALQISFNAVAGKEMYELGKMDGLKTIKQKVETKRPETSLNVDTTIPTTAKTIEEAFNSAWENAVNK